MQEKRNTKNRNRVFKYDYETAAHGPTLWGFLVLVPFLLILGGWAAFAEIDAAAIAAGQVVLNQDRKTVQHLEGGIIEDILVSEGQEIKRGEPILVIKDIVQRTRLNTIYDQLANARALHSRLIAERDNADTPDYSGLARDIDLPEEKFAALKTSQINLLNSRKASLETKIELIEGRKISAAKEIEGIEHQLNAVHTRLSLMREESGTLDGLYKQKLVTGNRIMELKRDTVELEGEAGTLAASIARLEQAILAMDIEIVDLKTEAQNAVLDELQQIELRIEELTHQMLEMTDQLSRTVIRAPAQGMVMDLQVHTKGAVIQPGARILDIVPNDDRLIIEARLRPTDIDLVSTGTKVKVLLSAYKVKKVPKLDGEVLNVSADILSDPATGERYFLTRILVNDDVLHQLKADVSLYPGMPAQVFFIAGERTVADYLISPIVDAAYRAFREE